MAAEMKAPYLGSIPIDPDIAESCDKGRAFVHRYAMSATAGLMRKIIKPIVALDGFDASKEK